MGGCNDSPIKEKMLTTAKKGGAPRDGQGGNFPRRVEALGMGCLAPFFQKKVANGSAAKK